MFRLSCFVIHIQTPPPGGLPLLLMLTFKEEAVNEELMSSEMFDLLSLSVA